MFISTDFFLFYFFKYLCRILLIQCTLKYSLHINHLRGTKSIDTCTGEPFFWGVVYSMTWATYTGMPEWENYVRLGHLRARCTIEGCKRGSKFMLPAMVKTNLLIGLERTWEKKTSSFLQDKLPELRGLSQTGKQWLNVIHKPSPTILAKSKQTTTITTKPGRKSVSKCFSQEKMLYPWKWVARQAYSTAPSPIRVKPWINHAVSFHCWSHRRTPFLHAPPHCPQSEDLGTFSVNWFCIYAIQESVSSLKLESNDKGAWFPQGKVGYSSTDSKDWTAQSA